MTHIYKRGVRNHNMRRLHFQLYKNQCNPAKEPKFAHYFYESPLPQVMLEIGLTPSCTPNTRLDPPLTPQPAPLPHMRFADLADDEVSLLQRLQHVGRFFAALRNVLGLVQQLLGIL